MDARFLAATLGTLTTGTLLAFFMAVLTRPSLFGIMLPMKLLFSDRPEHATAKIVLIEHLGFITGCGIVLSAASALIIVKVLKL